MPSQLAELAAAVFDGSGRPGFCRRVAEEIVFACLRPGAEIDDAVLPEIFGQILEPQQRAV